MLATARVEAVVPVRDLRVSRAFYEERLGLRPSHERWHDVDVAYQCGGGTRLLLYEHPGSWTQARTVAHFAVDDVEATVRALRSRGVEFQEWDLPRLKTVDGVATVDGRKLAWLSDPDLNVIGLHD
jgi:catechol 2,3-dioxygenase-like lactoylglutathione lyase family enzyme